MKFLLSLARSPISEKIKERFYSVRFIYFCLLLVYTLCREIVPIYDIVNGELISYLFFGTGILLILSAFIIDYKSFFKRQSLIMLSFIAVCILSSLINIKLGLIDNLKAIGWMTIYFFVAFFCATTPQKNSSRYITVITSIIVIAMGIFVVFSLPMYLYNIDYTYYNFNAAQITSNQGFSLEYVRLWGIFNEANRGAVYSLIGLASAVYLFITKKRVVVRIFTAIAALSFLVFIVLSQSRTALLISLVTCAWCTFYFVFKFLSNKTIRKLVLSILATFASVIVFYSIFSILQFTLPYIKQMVYSNTSFNTLVSIHRAYDNVYQETSLNIIDGFWDDEFIKEHYNSNSSSDEQDDKAPGSPQDTTLEHEELQRPDVNKDNNITNGRIKRWKDGLQIFTKTPIWGTSPRYVSNYAKIHCPETYIAKYDYVVHNGYLEVLVGTGILGFLPILLILLSTIFISVKKFINFKFDSKFMFMTLIAITFLCMSVLQTEVFFILTFGGSLFWYSLGEITRLEE